MCPGQTLDPRIHQENDSIQRMDCRIKSGNDDAGLFHSPHCAVMLAWRMTLLHSSASSAKNLAVSAGLVAPASSRNSRSLSPMSLLLRISTTSRLMRAASAEGVSGGATKPNQVIERNPGR